MLLPTMPVTSPCSRQSVQSQVRPKSVQHGSSSFPRPVLGSFRCSGSFPSGFGVLPHDRSHEPATASNGRSPAHHHREFCRLTGISPTTIKRMCDRHEIAHIVISERGDRRIPYREVDRLLAEAEAVRLGASR